MLAALKGVRTAMVALATGCVFSACADFTSGGMSGGLGSGRGTTSSGGSAGSTSSTSDGDASETTTEASLGSTDPVDDSSAELTSVGDDASGDSTGPEETTGPLTGFQDGTYTGPLTIVMVSAAGTYTCSGEITLTVAEDDEREVIGLGECQVTLPVLGALTGIIEVSGALALPLADGTATLTTDVDTADTTWAGAFAGDTLTGSFNGVYSISGYQVNYTGDWAADR